MALYSSKTTPIMQEYANRQTTKTDTVAKVGNSSINSIFNNKYSNGSTQANAPQESTAMSFTEKCAVVLTGLSVASAGISLAVAGKNLYDAFNPDDKKSEPAATGNTASSVSSKAIDGAVANAKASNNWNPVELLVSQSNTAILAKTQSKTALSSQETALNTEISGYQSTIDAGPQLLSDVEAQLAKDEAVADAAYDVETDGIDGKIADYQTELSKATDPKEKTKIKDAIDGLTQKKVVAEKKRTDSKAKAKQLSENQKKTINGDLLAAKEALAKTKSELKVVKEQQSTVDHEIKELTASRDKAQAELNSRNVKTKEADEKKGDA